MNVITPNPSPDRETLDALASKAHNFWLRSYLSANPLPGRVYVPWGESEYLWKTDCQRLVASETDPVAVDFLQKIGGGPPQG